MSINYQRHFFYWLFALGLIPGATRLDAQRRGRGLEFNDQEYLQVPQIALYNGGRADELPLKVDLTPFCPSPGDQGEIASCVGWACGYGALTTMLAQRDSITDRVKIDQMAKSALFVYNQIKIQACTEGAKLDKGVVFLQTTGDIPFVEFDTEIENCSKLPDVDQLKRAEQCRIRDYVRLFSPEATWREKAFKVKQSLALGKPVIAGVETTEGFLQLSADQDYWDPAVLPGPMGGHALVVVGYNEAKKAFHLLNSWGIAWSKNGYCWIKYEDFGKYCKYGFQCTLESEETASSSVELQGSFMLRIPEFAANDSLFFLPATVAGKGQYYETEKTDWEVGQFYQLAISDMPKDRYVYVFSIDPVKKAQIHFPEGGKVITKSGVEPTSQLSAKRSDLIPDASAELVIPEPRINPDGSLEQQGLVKAHLGADFLYILYSNRRIEPLDLESRIRSILLDEITMGVVQRFENAFKDILIPWADIQYEEAYMRFTARSDKGFVVPIILCLAGR